MRPGAPPFRDYRLLDELELMEQAGLPSVAVINAATGVSARRLRYKEDIGRIAPGAKSRFIVTPHRPSETVAALRQPRVVIFDGAVVMGAGDGPDDVLGL